MICEVPLGPVNLSESIILYLIWDTTDYNWTNILNKFSQPTVRNAATSTFKLKQEKTEAKRVPNVEALHIKCYKPMRKECVFHSENNANSLLVFLQVIWKDKDLSILILNTNFSGQNLNPVFLGLYLIHS